MAINNPIRVQNPDGSFSEQSAETIKPIPIEKTGTLRALGDTLLKFGQGATGATKAIADSAGANNVVSRNLQTATDFLGSGLSQERQIQDQVEAQRMRNAKTGMQEIGAAFKNFTDSPLDTFASGAGSIVPTAAAMLLSKGKVSPKTLGAGLGVVQGAGAVKGSIYDQAKQEALSKGMSEQQAEDLAQGAQAYTGKNQDQIALGAGLGYLAGKTGAETSSLLTGEAKDSVGLLRSTLKGFATEGATEGLQGAQEKFAANQAVRREGSETPLMQGVIGQGATEAIAGGLTGGAFGVVDSFAEPKEQLKQTILSQGNNGVISQAATTAIDTGASDPVLGNLNPPVTQEFGGLLPNYAYRGNDPLVVFPDGSTMTQSEAFKYGYAPQQGGENVSNQNEIQTPEMATQAVPNGTDNVQGSAGNTLSEPIGTGLGELAATPRESGAGDIQSGTDAVGGGEAVENFVIRDKATGDVIRATQDANEGNYLAPSYELVASKQHKQDVKAGKFKPVDLNSAKAGDVIDLNGVQWRKLDNGGFEQVMTATLTSYPQVTRELPDSLPATTPTGEALGEPLGNPEQLPQQSSNALQLGREGYDTPAEFNAQDLKVLYEQETGEPLAWNQAKLDAIKAGAKSTGNIEVAIGANGKFGFNDGMHRVANAADNNKTVKVFADKDSIAEIQRRISQLPSNPRQLVGNTDTLTPAQSAKLQEAHKALGRDVTKEQVQRMRDKVANEIATGKTNNGGVMVSLKPSAIEERKQQLSRLDADLGLFGETQPNADKLTINTPQVDNNLQQAEQLSGTNALGDGLNARGAQENGEALSQNATENISNKFPTQAPKVSNEPKSITNEEVEGLFGLPAKREKALKRIAEGKGWFGGKEKAKEFVRINGLSDTHEVVKGKGLRWDVVEKKAKSETAPVSTAAQSGNVETEKFNVVSVNDKTGEKTPMTATPVTEREGNTIISKNTVREGRTLQLESAEGQADIQQAMTDAVNVDNLSNEQLDQVAGILGIETDKPKKFAYNKVFTSDAVEKARARLNSKLGNINSGIDPELLIDGMTIAGAYIESGVRTFSAYSKAMVADFGEGIKPYLLSFYEAARAYPGIEKEGMSSIEDAQKEYDALITPAVKEQVKEVIGNGNVKADKKPAKRNGESTLTQDWGVQYIDGWTDNKDGTGTNERENGITNGVKDQFLSETKRYLSQVATFLEEAGFEPYKLKNGKADKAVSVNESGPAVSGDVTLSMRNGDIGVYISIGASSVSFMSGGHPQHVAIMARAFTDADKNRWGGAGTSGTGNNWLPTDLNATSLADKVLSLTDGLLKNNTTEAQDYVKNANEINPFADMAIGEKRTGNDGAVYERTNEGYEQVSPPLNPYLTKDKENARTIKTKPVPAGTPQSDLFSEQSGSGDSKPMATRMARESDGANTGEPVRAGVQEPSGNRAQGTGTNDRDGSPSATRENGDAGNQPRATNDGVTDFEITDNTELGQGSAGEKYKNNVAAIKIIKALEAESRQATPEEREALAKYAGFGALSGVFDRNNAKFSKEYAELKALLTPEEYDAARASIRNAYYTSPAIVKSMYDGIAQLGFKGGRVLEPSLGSGNFFGMMPAGMRNKSDLNGVELDVITSRLAKHLYPNANIATSTGFQDYNAPNDYFDLVISNPPFGDEKLTDKDKTAYSGFSIHNYFIAKSIDKLREGGVMAVVVSHSFMDANNTKAREWIAQRANLVGAVRLPKEAFKVIAGTEVITDILYFQKTASPEANPDWINATDNGKYSFNDYFIANPRNVLGRVTETTNQFGITYTVETVKGTLQQNLKEFNAGLPQSIYVAPTKRSDVLDSADNTVPDGVKVGTFYLDDNGVVRQRLTDVMNNKRSMAVEMPNEGSKKRILGMMELRDTLRTQMRLERNADATQSEIEANRKELNKQYDQFVKDFGYLNSMTNRRLFLDDTESALLQALELDYDQGVSALKAKSTGMEEKPASATKADIFKQRVLFPPSDMVVVSNAKDALLASLNAKGMVDIDYMTEAYGKSEGEIVSELGDVLYKDPVNGYVTADEYLSGDVKTKLADAIYAAKSESEFKRNVEALEKVIPKDKLPSEIFASPGANWIPHKVYEEFASEITGIQAENMRFNYLAATATWLHERGTGGDAGKMTSDYGTDKINSYDLFVMLLNGKTPEIKYTVRNPDGTTTTNTNIEATEEARSKYLKIKELWDSWLYADANRADELATIYNEKHNRIVKREYDGAHMTFAGMTPVMNGKAFAGLRPHQKDVVWRAIQDRNVLLDHVVGAGKTMAMAATAMEMKRLGIARKPLFVVPNHLTLQWRSEFTKLYPASNILAATPDDFAKDKRERMFSKMVTGNYDAIIIGHSSLKKIGLPADVEARMYNEQVKEIANAIEQMKEERGDKSIVRDMEKIKTNLENKIKDLQAKAGEKDNVVSFDELGVDALFIDEMHEFKNLFFTTQMQRTSGLGNPKGSGKALDLFMKVKWLTETLGENAPLITATGTPVSNSLAEMFTMQRYMKYADMKRADLHLFDAWAKQYGEVENVYEVAPSGVGYRQSTRFSKFKNLPSLMASYNTFADVITLQDLKDQTAQQLDADGNPKKFPVPKLKTGKPINVIAKRSELQTNFFGVPKLATDADGNILFEIDPESATIEKNKDDKFVLRHSRGQSTHDTQEEAELELASNTLAPKTYLDPESLLGKFANLKELTKKTNGKVNALSLTGLANKAGLDYRLIDPSAPDFADSKINQAVTNMVQEYKNSAKDKGTQLVFCDMSIPNSARAGMASKEKRVYVRDGKNLVTHKSKGTVYSPDSFEGYPFYLVKETAGIAVYEAVSGVNMMTPNLADRTEAKAWIDQFVQSEANRDKVFAMRDQYAIEAAEIEEYREEKELEVAEDGSNEISLEDLEAIAGSSKFSVYDDIKAKLMAQGVLENEIAFIHDYNTPKRKEMLFKQVNRGEVRFLLGSTPKLGAGTNVQERLVALHHIDAPWRPSDLEQREGRIIRQGNKLYERDPEGFEVGIYRYATEQTYDTRRWQLLEHKAAGIEQLRKYSGESEIEDVTSEAANSADMKAAASGNPLILEETKLRTEVKRLNSLQKAHGDSKYSMARKIKSNDIAMADRFPKTIEMYRELIASANSNPIPSDKEAIASINVDGLKTTNKAKAEDAISAVATRVRQSYLSGDNKLITYRGVEFTLERGLNMGELKLFAPDGQLAYYKVTDSFSPSGFITRLNNYIDSLESKIDNVNAYIAQAKKENESLSARVNEPFEFEALLKQTQAKHADVQRKLMKSTQLEAIPKEQVVEFKRVIEARKESLKELGYGKALGEYEKDGDTSLALNQNQAQYKPYDKDLFGNEISTNTAEQTTANADSAAAIQDGAEYYARAVAGSSQERQLGAVVIRNAEQAAQATQYLYKSAVERLDGIVTDDAGKPLAVVGGFKGAVMQTNVYPSTIISEAMSVPGATKLWLSHNHPSGTAELSRADIQMHNTYKKILEGSGIELQGLIAVAGNEFGSIGVDGEYSMTTIKKPLSFGKKVPIIERELIDSRADSVNIDSPFSAKISAKAMYDKAKTAGIMMLDAQNRVSAWVPISETMLGKLRNTGGLNAIYKAVANGNPSSVILVHGGELDAKFSTEFGSIKAGINIASALKALDVKTLDVININEYKSATERGEEIDSNVVFSRATSDTAIASIPELRTKLVDKIQADVNAVKKGWKGAPDVVVVYDMNDERIPKGVRAENERQLSQGATGQPEGFYVGDKAYIVASEMRTRDDVMRTLFHEVLGHAGLRGVFNKTLDKELRLITIGRKSDVIKKARGYGQVGVDENGVPLVDVKTATDAEVWAAMTEKNKMVSAEEVLAELAQTKPELNLVQRAIAAIRTWLRENVPYFKDLAMTDAEVIRNFILPARNFIENGGKAKTAKGVVFDRTRDTNFFGRKVAPLAMKAYEGLSVKAKNAIDNWNVNWDISELAQAKSAVYDEIYKAYQPVRDAIKSTYGDTIELYRGERAGGEKSGSDRKLYSWTPSNELAMQFGKGVKKLPTKITQADVDKAVDKFNATGYAEFSGYQYIKASDDKYYSMYQDKEFITGGESKDIAIDMQSAMQDRNEHTDRINESGIVRKEAISVDDIAFVPVNKNINMPEMVVYTSDALPDTITVDGIPRPTLNSNGKPIHPTREGIENFWRWFVDSVTVDESGAPIVYYHGTRKEFDVFEPRQPRGAIGNPKGIYFDTNKRVALEYAEDTYGEQDTRSRVIEAYVRVTGDADGVIKNRTERGDKEQEVIAFNPNQVKAVNNTGSFSPNNDSILFSRSPQAVVSDAVAKASSRDDIIGKAMTVLSEPSTREFGFFSNIRTQLDKARQDPKGFGRMFNVVGRFENDARLTAARPAELAPSILGGYASDTVKEALNQIVRGDKSQADKKAVAGWLFEGTTAGANVLDGKVFTPDELRARKATEKQIGMYFEARKAVNRSLEEATASIAYNMVKREFPELRDAIMDNPGQVRTIFNAAWMNRIKEMQDYTENVINKMPAGKELVDIKAKQKTDFENLSNLKKAVNNVYDHSRDLMGAGYMPLSRFGTYSVTAFYESGEVAEFYRLETEAEAKLKQKELEKSYANVKRGIMPTAPNTLFAGADPDTVALFLDYMGDIEGFDVNDATFQEWYRNAVSDRSALKRMIERKGTAGYSEDLDRVLANFITSNSRFAAQNYNRGDMLETLEYLRTDPEYKRKGDVFDEAKALYDYVNNPAEPFKFGRTLMFTWFMGGSLSSAAVNMTQPLTMTLPWLYQYTSVTKAGRALANASKLAGAIAMQGRKVDGKLGEALTKAREIGLVDPQETHHLFKMGAGGLINGMSASKDIRTRMTGAATMWGMMFSKAEQFNRYLTFITAYNLATADSKLGDPFEFAKRAVEETQGIYGKNNRPNWARGTGSLGAVGAMAFTFKQYSIAYVEMLTRMARSGPDGKHAALLALGILFLLAGGMGLPFADDEADLLDTALQMAGGEGNTRRHLRKAAMDTLGEDLGLFALYGVSAFMPIDIQGRLGMGNLIPSTALLMPSNEENRARSGFELLGASGSLFSDSLDALQGLENGKTLMDMAGQFAPVAIKNAVKGNDMASTGFYADTKGRKVTDTTESDALWKAMGFQPAVVARAQKEAQAKQQTIARAKQKESAIADMMAKARFENDPAKAQKANDMLLEWNTENPDAPIKITPRQIIDRLKQMRMTREERQNKATPRELRGLL